MSRRCFLLSMFGLSEVAARCFSSGKRGARLNATAQGVARQVRSNLPSVGPSGEKPLCPPMVERKRRRLPKLFFSDRNGQGQLRTSPTALRNIPRRNRLIYSYASRSSMCLHESSCKYLCTSRNNFPSELFRKSLSNTL